MTANTGPASFFALARLDDAQFMSWGWRLPLRERNCAVYRKKARAGRDGLGRS
jgi:hypothetical protein